MYFILYDMANFVFLLYYSIYFLSFTQISVLQIESYPSKRIIKILPKIFSIAPYLRKAYKFIQTEEVSFGLVISI